MATTRIPLLPSPRPRPTPDDALCHGPRESCTLLQHSPPPPPPLRITTTTSTAAHHHHHIHHRAPSSSCFASPTHTTTPIAPDLPCPALPGAPSRSPVYSPTAFPFRTQVAPLHFAARLHTEADPCPESGRTDAAVDSAIPRPPCYPPGHPRPRRAGSPSLLLTRCLFRLADHSTAHITLPCPSRPRYLDTTAPLISGLCSANSGTCVLTTAPRTPQTLPRLTCPAPLRLCIDICTTEPLPVHLHISTAPSTTLLPD
ncbi:hypothetical protein PMIN01_08307 [Paraphaeosphaeria minitans]|uniref:Uncharacterized protein n=1 Tax=Paraphaeosphaeria minitans TaxID=565426 RepID=A0A9P6GEJ2_9PLEO|nr:hypothetical protein PMIN01_08307 [Paraphaeosphaeria minitans]